MNRVRLIVTNHAILRWQQRIDRVGEAEAALAIVSALGQAKDKHFRPWKLKKRTFYIPTPRALIVGSYGKIVTVLERAPDDKWAHELDAPEAINAGEVI